MRTGKTKTLFLERSVAFLIGAILVSPLALMAQTLRGGGDFLQPGDVKTSHILDGTILNADISSGAQIQPSKISGGGAGGSVLFSQSTAVGTSSNLKYATSTNDLYVLGGRVHASSTNFNGVSQTWPSADGSNGQALKTNGSGTLSWGTVSASGLVADFTTGDAIAVGAPVFVASSTKTNIARATCSVTGIDPIVGESTSDFGWAFTYTPTRDQPVDYVRAALKTSGTPADSLQITINNNVAGVPGASTYATGTIAAASLSGTYANYNVHFSTGTTTLTGGTQYWIVFDRTGARHATNYYHVRGQNTDPCSQHSGAKNVSGTWSANAVDLDAGLHLSTITGRVYNADADNFDESDTFIGLANATAAFNSTVSVVVGGIFTNGTGFSAGNVLYISNTAGATSTTPGTVSRKICITTSATDCKVLNGI